MPSANLAACGPSARCRSRRHRGTGRGSWRPRSGPRDAASCPRSRGLSGEACAKTLLLAAGGIADGRGLAAALMLGADGVLIGTRFWASAEALTPQAMTDRAVRATGDDTVRTKAIDRLRGVPWPQEFSFRVLKNKFTDEWAHREAEGDSARQPCERVRRSPDEAGFGYVFDGRRRSCRAAARPP